MLKKTFMKKLAVGLSLSLALLQLGFIPTKHKVNAATTDYTWNNTIPVKSPTSGSNGKLILFDNTHFETAGAADWVIDGGFSDFADALVARGYTCKEYRGVDKNGDGVYRYYDDRQSANVSLNEQIITYDAIKDADVFVMAEANRPFTIDERAALKQFVDSGKGLYFIADHYNADRDYNCWDSTEVYDGYNRSNATTYNMGGIYGDMRNPQVATTGWLAENFGLRFRFNAIDYTAGVSGIKSSAYSEGITNGVQPILMAAGSTLAITDGSKAKGIIYFSSSDTPTKWGSAADSGIYFGGENEGAFVAISKPSAGKAAFIGDSSPIEDITGKYKREDNGSSKSLHDGFKSAGNANLLSMNIINWLCTPESYVGFDGINHSQGTNTPIPMADVEKNETQAEPWSTPTYNPWDTSTFAYGSYNAPQGPASTTTVAVTGVTLDKSTMSIAAGSTGTLTATISPSNATNKSVTWSTSNSSVATVSSTGTVTGVAAGTATITVKTVDGGYTKTCTVTVTSAPTTGDTYEPNDSTSSAYTISAGTTYSSYIYTSTDVDYYKFSGIGTSSTINLTNLAGDYDLYVYNSSGTLLYSSENSGTTSESITFTPSSSSTYYIKVNGYNGAYSTTTKYNLVLTTTAPPTTGDTYEPNDSNTSAYAISVGTTYSSYIYTSTDVDYYKFSGVGSARTITLSNLGADYDLYVYSSNMKLLYSSQKTGTTSETISYTPDPNQTYYIKVVGYNGAYSTTTKYNLLLN